MAERQIDHESGERSDRVHSLHAGTPRRRDARWLLLACALALAGCGGGGSSGVASNTGTTPGTTTTTPSTLSGVVASGGPVAGALVQAIDNSGNVVVSSTSHADGSYTLTLPAGAAPPLLIKASNASITLSSVWPPAAGQTISGVVNVTPLTNLLTSLLSQNGNPAATGSGAVNLGQLSVAAIQAQSQAILAMLAPVTAQIGGVAASLSTSTATPYPLINTPFQANGSGIDLLLDSVHISVVPAAGGPANIQVSVQQVLNPGAVPPSVQFTSSQTPPVLAAPTGTLPPAGLAASMQAFVGNFNACMAQPLTTRVIAGSLSSASCLALFQNSDPTTYLSNGQAIAKAWPMLFDSTQTGGTLSDPRLQFGRMTTPPGSTTPVATWIYTMTWAAPPGAGGVSFPRDNFELPASASGSGSAVIPLVLLGDQYSYKAKVRAFGQLREFVNDSPDQYWSSGYTVNVANQTSGGLPIFDHVVVTTPPINGTSQTITLVPSAGSSYLVEAGHGCTDFLRYAHGMFSPAPSGVNVGNPADPASYESLLFVGNLSDAQIAQLADQGPWQFDFYLASAPTTLASTQYYRTLTRMMGLAELQAQGVPSLVSPTPAALATASTSTVNAQFSAYLASTPTSLALAAPASGPATYSWALPATGGEQSSALSVYGYDNASAAGFNDSTALASADLSGKVSCTPQTVADLHCVSGNYSTSDGIIGIEIDTVDSMERNYSHFYAIYKLY